MVVLLVISFFFQLFNINNCLIDTEYLICGMLPIVSSLLLTVYYVKFRNEAWAALSVPIALLFIGFSVIIEISIYGCINIYVILAAIYAISCIASAITILKGMHARFISKSMILAIILLCVRIIYFFVNRRNIFILCRIRFDRYTMNYIYYIRQLLLFASIALVSTKCDISKKISFRKTEKFLLNSTSEQALLRLKSELEQNKISQDEYNYLRAKVIKRL